MYIDEDDIHYLDIIRFICYNKSKGVDSVAAKNIVLSGKYKGLQIVTNKYCDHAFVQGSKGGGHLSKYDVASYEVITEEKYKSGTSAILRGAAGVALLGGIGVLAALSAKSKGIYVIAVEWKNGEKSLIEIDDRLYKRFLQSMF